MSDVLLEAINKILHMNRWEWNSKYGKMGTEIPGWLRIKEDINDANSFTWYVRISSINTITCNDDKWFIHTTQFGTIPITIEQAAQIMSGVYQ